MPKKFTGENSKAAAARARKEAIKKGEAERKKQAEEDEYWRDDDKGVLRKQQRKVSVFGIISYQCCCNLYVSLLERWSRKCDVAHEYHPISLNQLEMFSPENC